MSLRIIVMGTPDFAVPTLVECIGQGHQIVACYTQPPRPAGRGMAETRSPIHVQADAFGIQVLTPATLKTEQVQADFAEHAADVAVVVAYGQILPRAILKAPSHGCLNLHASILPRWRGAAPIQRAIMAGDRETGVAVMRMEEGLDTGPVCMAEKIVIGANETAGELHDRLSRLGADLMARALAALSRDTLTCADQPDDGVTYAAKIDKAEAEIDWARPAGDVHDHIRGLSPFPAAWFHCRLNDKTERIKVLRSTLVEGPTGAKPGTLLDDSLTVACADGAVRLTDVQRAGKAVMPAADFLRGASLQTGDHLGG